MNKLVRFSYLHLHWGGSVDPFALIILWHWVWIPCTTSTLFRFIFELWFEKDKKTNRRGQDWADGSPCTSIFLNMVLSDSFRSFSFLFVLFTSRWRKNCRQELVFAWDSNPRPQDAKRRLIHWALAPTFNFKLLFCFTTERTGTRWERML